MFTWLHAQNGIRNDQLRIRNIRFGCSDDRAGEFQDRDMMSGYVSRSPLHQAIRTQCPGNCPGNAILPFWQDQWQDSVRMAREGLPALTTLCRENCRESRSATPSAEPINFRKPCRRRTKCPAKCPARSSSLGREEVRHHLISYLVDVLAPLFRTRPSFRV